jgi:BioD-like phosphotransacetylase family protein
MKTYRSNEPDFMKEVEEMFNEDKPKKKVDWEDLARNLEKALNDEMKENEKLNKEIQILKMESDSIVEHHKYLRNVIYYLESKLGYNSVRGD